MRTRDTTIGSGPADRPEQPAYRFEKLRVWQRAMDFCVLIYDHTKKFPKEEMFGLTSQLRRAATSIPLNIAEGCACQTRKEFIQFLTVALRSQYEAVTGIRLANRLRLIEKSASEVLEKEAAAVGKLLQALVNSLRTKSNNQQPATNNASP